MVLQSIGACERVFLTQSVLFIALRLADPPRRTHLFVRVSLRVWCCRDVCQTAHKRTDIMCGVLDDGCLSHTKVGPLLGLGLCVRVCVCATHQSCVKCEHVYMFLCLMCCVCVCPRPCSQTRGDNTKSHKQREQL